MHQNHCRFNNTFYKPPKGLAMESPISLILTEIFMNDFENRVLKGSRFLGMIKHWAKYVDDILIVWSGTDGQVDLLLKETNAMHKDIKFSGEKGNRTINHLDLTLIVNREASLQNLQKPTCTDTIILEDFPKHIMAAMENNCHRSITVLKD